MVPPTIATERLILTAPLRAHFATHCATMSDARVASAVGTGLPQSRIETWRRFCQGAGLWPLLGYGYWSILDRKSGHMIGMGGLASFERGITALEGAPEIGYAFNANWWGRGLATKFAIAAMHWSDAALGASEVRAIVHPENRASTRVLKKAGFAAFDTVKHDDDVSLLFARRRCRR